MKGGRGYPEAFMHIPDPPSKLYVIGNVKALREGLAIVGSRKATPYGRGCARRFARRAAKRGIVIVSGGARGCDAEAHKGALAEGGETVVFMGGGCDKVYPAENWRLFQDVVDAGGALASEHPWDAAPLPFMFRLRNRLIAGLAKATLIVEAGMPSGTFSTADEALSANKEVLAVPGSIECSQSKGANRLIYQGAVPIVDDDTFDDQLFSIFGQLKQEGSSEDSDAGISLFDRRLLDAIAAQTMGIEEINSLAKRFRYGNWSPAKTNLWIARMESAGRIAKYPGGRYGANVRDV